MSNKAVPAVEYDGRFYRVYRYGFISGIYTSEADALAHHAKLVAQTTNHPDYSLIYPSRDGTGKPEIRVHPTVE